MVGGSSSRIVAFVVMLSLVGYMRWSVLLLFLILRLISTDVQIEYSFLKIRNIFGFDTDSFLIKDF